MSVIDVPEPVAPKKVDVASARALHMRSIQNLEAAFEAVVIRTLRSVLREVASGFGAITAASEPGEPFISLDDLGMIGSSWSSAVDAKLTPLLADTYITSAQGVGLAKAGVAAVVPDVVNHEAAEWLGASSNRLKGIGDDAWHNVRAELVDGLQAGESVPELKKRVRGALDVTEGRARTIARTEVIGATNAGAFAQAKAMGVETKTWLATDDTKTRPTHNFADDQAVPFDEPFMVGGYRMRFPHDPLGPPGETVNCRCTLLFDDAPLCACVPPWVTKEAGSLVAAAGPECGCSDAVDLELDSESLRLQAVDKAAKARAELTDEAKESLQAIDGYTSTGYGLINGTLRGADPLVHIPEEMREAYRQQALLQIGRMDRAFDVLGVTNDQPMTVYRFIASKDTYASLAGKTGSTMVDDAFMSTTTSRELAANQSGVGGVLEIKVPAGRVSISGSEGEGELIFARGTELHVVQEADGVLKVEMV